MLQRATAEELAGIEAHLATPAPQPLHASDAFLLQLSRITHLDQVEG